jgi:hypothetical protein
MTWRFDPNNPVGVDGGAEVMFAFKTLMEANGWDVPAWSDGSTYMVAGGITHMGTGANGMNNSRAWFRLRAPAAMTPRREWVIQRSDYGGTYWWIQVSAEDGFTLGGTATAVPTATDQQNLIGTDFHGIAIFGAPSAYKFHIGMDDASPFGWFIVAVVNGTGVVNRVILFDPMIAGSYPAEDDDPAIYLCVGSTPYNGMFGKCWYRKNELDEAWVDVTGHYFASYSTGIMIPGLAGTNPYNGCDNHFVIPWGRGSAFATQVGWKGFGSLARWIGIYRADMDTLAVVTARDMILVGAIALPWSGDVPII